MRTYISIFQLFCIITLSTGVSNHSLLVPLLLHAGMRDTWLGVSLTLLLLVLPVCLLFHKLLRQAEPGGLTGLLATRYGRFATVAVKAPFFIFAYGFMFIALKETMTWINVTYLPRTPPLLLAFAIILLCAFIALSGLRTLAIMSGLLLPLVVALGIFVTVVTMQYVDFSILFPLFTQGVRPSANSAAYAATGLMELVFLLVVSRYVKQPFKRWHVIAFGAVIIGLTVVPVAAVISIFGPFEAADLRYPTFEQWRMGMRGKFITRLDSFSVYQWISGVVVRIQFYLLIMVELLPSSRPLHRPAAVLLIGGSIIALAALPLNDVMLFDMMYRYFFPGWLGICAALALALLVVTRPLARRREAS